MKCYLKVMVVAVLGLLASGCFTMFEASRSYVATSNNIDLLPPDSHNIDHIKPISLRVSSQKIWQNTGVFLEKGDVVTINANGSWSPWPSMGLWCGPDGVDLWSKEVSDISGSALMGRLGYKGKPFQVGFSRSFRAGDYGMLYLAMNDPFKYLHDNQGDMSTEIYIDANRNNKTATDRTSGAYKITAYSYDDQKRIGYISAVVGNQSFAVRKWLLNKIGEIASSKNVALDARKNTAEGGAYRVTNEKVANGVLSIEFETIW